MKINIHFWSYLAQFFSEWEKFLKKHCTENQNTDFINFVFKILTVYKIMRKNIVEPDRLMTRLIDTFAGLRKGPQNGLNLLQTINTNILYKQVGAYVSNVAVGTRKGTSTHQDAYRRPHWDMTAGTPLWTIHTSNRFYIVSMAIVKIMAFRDRKVQPTSFFLFHAKQ